MHWSLAGSVCPQGPAGVSGVLGAGGDAGSVGGHQGVKGMSGVYLGAGRECRFQGPAGV